MSSPQPPPIPEQDQASSLRRHHTISTSSRTKRNQTRTLISEVVDHEDEVVGDEWVGGVGAVGEGAGLHRQHSLPSKYHRGSRSNRNTQTGTLTPSRGMNSLSVITAEHGTEAEGEEEWEREIRGWRGDDDEFVNSTTMAGGTGAYHSAMNHERSLSQSSHSSGITPMFSPPPSDRVSPPGEPALATPVATSGATVRRHQSLTYGAGGGTGSRSLMRSATGGKNMRMNSRMHTIDTVDTSDTPYYHDASGGEGDDPDVITSPVTSSGHGRPWVNASSTAWGAPQQQYQDELIQDVQRTLANMDINSQSQASSKGGVNQYGGYLSSAVYGQTLAQPSINPNLQKRLTPPPSGPPRFRSPSPGHANNTDSPLSHLITSIGSPSSSQIYTPTAVSARSTKLSLVTDLAANSGYHGSNTAQNQYSKQGPVSAAAYVPPIGGGLPINTGVNPSVNVEPLHSGIGSSAATVTQGNRDRDREKPMTASGVVWDQKDRVVGSRTDPAGNKIPTPLNNNGQYLSDPASLMAMDSSLQRLLQQHLYQQGQVQQQQQQSHQHQQSSPPPLGAAPPEIQMQALWQQMQLLQQQITQQQQQSNVPHGQYAQAQSHGIPSRLNTNVSVGSNGSSNGGPSNFQDNWGAMSNRGANASAGTAAYPGSPVDMPSLIASKGYNPTNFDIRPAFARYFVIKSYTEDDVHKSLKYEIWSSTDPGNKRLDKAFKECNGRGPIYLFFSVNASGHFCGMAEMLTPVDYTRSSTVWAQDKWKGVFKVRWIFVKDIPNSALRQIRLSNTQERKPVTNSRDTQELLPEAGHEMLRIFSTHISRTSLLQDFAFYELQSMQKVQPPSGAQQSSATQPPGQGGLSSGLTSQHLSSQLLPHHQNSIGQTIAQSMSPPPGQSSQGLSGLSGLSNTGSVGGY